MDARRRSPLEFSRPTGKGVKTRPTSPKGTGYVRWLYRLETEIEEATEAFERLFYGQVDNLAKDALKPGFGVQSSFRIMSIFAICAIHCSVSDTRKINCHHNGNLLSSWLRQRIECLLQRKAEPRISFVHARCSANQFGA
jgi:hypothetical protein